jgi:predicted Zn-dependent peptidase
MDGPRFDSNNPDISDYLHFYKLSIEELEKLVAALKIVAFPQAPEQSQNLGTRTQTDYTTTTPSDVIEEIKRYKALMEEGIITQQEFNSKKKQLLGI